MYIPTRCLAGYRRKNQSDRNRKIISRPPSLQTFCLSTSSSSQKVHTCPKVDDLKHTSIVWVNDACTSYRYWYDTMQWRNGIVYRHRAMTRCKISLSSLFFNESDSERYPRKKIHLQCNNQCVIFVANSNSRTIHLIPRDIADQWNAPVPWQTRPRAPPLKGKIDENYVVAIQWKAFMIGSLRL